MPPSDVAAAKQLVRERVWTALDAARAVRSATSHGRIPDFLGANEAADRLANLPRWQSARIIKAVPDKAQYPIRARALVEGKTVYMAVPRLAGARPFYLLDPRRLPPPLTAAATSAGAAEMAPMVDVDALGQVDIVVVGSVAVDRSGNRLGKGAGYSDMEFALLVEAGLITSKTLVVTTVHPLQVLSEQLPTEDHDFGVDLIVTPDDVISCPHPHRPHGLRWDRLPTTTIAAIPTLANHPNRPGSVR